MIILNKKVQKINGIFLIKNRKDIILAPIKASFFLKKEMSGITKLKK
jgi:hypothetical protein